MKNVITRSKENIILKGIGLSSTDQALKDKPSTRTMTQNYREVSSFGGNNYLILQQLQCTNAQITIFELLKISPKQMEILDKALAEASVPKELDLDQFQSMAGHLTSLHYLFFSKEDDNSLSHPHNQAFHIKVMTHKSHIKHVLIDGGARLNIFSYNWIQQLGFSEHAIDLHKKITIKAYGEEEMTSKGLVVIPIRVGPIEREIYITYQVLDTPLSYNILFRHPWIHEMQVVPSTYHYCIKFPHNGVEVIIVIDTRISCNTLIKGSDTFVPHNREHVGNYEAKLKDMEKSLKLKDIGMGNYSLPVLSLTSLP